MAETLGSLVDKLAIKNIRLYHLKKRKGKDRVRMNIVESQRRDLINELDQFLAQALKGKVKLKDEKVKLYRQPKVKEKISKTLGGLVAQLCERNLELWLLEDEVRRTDVTYAYVGKIKRKIDIANQSRNDLIDRIDELLDRKINKAK